MKTPQKTVGIDIGGTSLDVCYCDWSGRLVHRKVANTRQGFEELLSSIGKDFHYVMEASGPYCLNLAFFLKEHGVKVSVENALHVKRYIQMQGERNKSDKKDAYWLWHYSQHRECKCWVMPSAEQLRCQQLLKGIDLYTRQLTMLSNQQHALDTLPVQDPGMRKSLKRMAGHLEKELRKLEQELDTILQSWVPEQVDMLKSIPGLGKRAVALLIVFTDGFKKVDNYRQLISLAGLSPRQYSSGSSIRGKVRICKMGGGALGNVLYMCSLSAIKYNKACKDLYERLKAKGKNGKIALIAVCNKLLKQAFAIAKSNTAYDQNYLPKKLVF